MNLKSGVEKTSFGEKEALSSPTPDDGEYVQLRVGEAGTVDVGKVTDSRLSTPCVIWTGYVTNGYGKDGSRWVHRKAYEEAFGSIPAGLTIDHLCRNKLCMNPRHLEAVTLKENVLRGNGPTAVNARKTHCPTGHPYDEKNTLVSKKGWRYCRACFRIRYQRQKAAKSAA